MRVDRVIADMMRSLRQALQALDSNITVQDNFGPSGADAGSVLVSEGRTKKPVWKQASLITDSSGQPVLKGDKGDPGPPGPPGECPDCEDDLTFLNRIVTSGGEVVVSGGNVVWS